MFGLGLVELAQGIEHPSPLRTRHPCWVVKIKYRVTLSAKLDPLKATGKKTRPPQPVVERLSRFAGAVGGQGNVGRQIGIVRTQAVTDPGTNAGAPRNNRAGLETGRGRIMVDRFPIHGLDHANIIRHLGEVRHGLPQFDPARSVPFEFQSSGSDRKTCLTRRHGGLALVGIDRLGHLLAKLFMQPGLVVEQVMLRRTARLEKIDHTFHLGL